MHVSNEVVKNVRVGSLIKSLSRLAKSPEEINYRKKCSPLRGQLSRTDRKGDGKLGYNFTASLSLDSIRKTTKSHFFKVAARTKNTPREIGKNLPTRWRRRRKAKKMETGDDERVLAVGRCLIIHLLANSKCYTE